MTAFDLMAVPEILSKGRDLVRRLESGEIIYDDALQRLIARRFIDIVNNRRMTAREQQMVVTLVRFLNPETPRDLPVAQQTTANSNDNSNDDDRDEVDSVMGDMR